MGYSQWLQTTKISSQAILAMVLLSNVKQANVFADNINFIKDHVPWYAEILKPITKLTKKGERFVWKQVQ